MLVPRLCLGMHTRRLCLREAEPHKMHYEAEPRNEMPSVVVGIIRSAELKVWHAENV